MNRMTHGNGSGKFDIISLDMGGWVRVFTDKLPGGIPEHLGVCLSQTLSERIGRELLHALVPID